MSSLISCVTWVRRGVAAQHPAKYNLDEKELERISSLARIELEDARVELERASEAAKSMGQGFEDDDDNWEDEKSENEGQDCMDEDTVPPTQSDPDDLSAYRLDEYDNEAADTAIGPFSNIKGLTYYRNNEEDPYITLKEDGDDEREELEILASDNLLVTAKTEDDISQLEVYVYDETQESLYVHHDIMLPSFPLCLEWLDFHPSGPTPSIYPFSTGNYVAVGTMEPEIEIWSLDTLEAIYPASVLGRPDLSKAHTPVPLGTGKKKRKRIKAREVCSAHHVDAVLGLAWNRSQRNLLASASADTTVKLWDLTRSTGEEQKDSEGALRSFQVHDDKVQSVQWNDKEPTVILTGSYDRTVRTMDFRTPEKCLVAVLGADVEALRWDPWESHSFFVSLENGLVLNYDTRTLPSDNSSLSRPRFTLAAHDGAAPALDVNPHIRGCLVTGGTDKLVKVWNILGDTNQAEVKRDVSLVTSRDLGIGKVFSAVFSPDDPLTIAAAGSKAKLQLWDVGANPGARKTFEKRLAVTSQALKERTNGEIIGVVSDNEDESGEND